jgi:hypothetical protein
MPNKRDNFPKPVKELLSKRVGHKCSRCRQSTIGPHTDPAKTINTGVASHISGAAKNGPRYNPNLTSEQRRHQDNGVWLCQNCGKLADSDISEFTEDELRQWKDEAEARQKLEQTGRGLDQEGERRRVGRYQILECVAAGVTLRLAWQGPLEELATREPPHVVSGEEMRAIHCALCRYQSDTLLPVWGNASGTRLRDVWLVDGRVEEKRRIRCEAQPRGVFLKVDTMRGEPCGAFCPLCGRPSGGDFCGPCNKPSREVRVVRCP